jgi:hypothetical protein
MIVGDERLEPVLSPDERARTKVHAITFEKIKAPAAALGVSFGQECIVSELDVAATRHEHRVDNRRLNRQGQKVLTQLREMRGEIATISAVYRRAAPTLVKLHMEAVDLDLMQPACAPRRYGGWNGDAGRDEGNVLSHYKWIWNLQSGIALPAIAKATERSNPTKLALRKLVNVHQH